MNNEDACLDSLNYIFIVLIPEKTSLESINEYRPIALLKCVIKIFSKILATYLAPHLQEMIGDTQTGFFARRSALDGVAIVQEMIHHCRKTDREGYLVKLDFEKAYDKVDWECILETLSNRGFSPKWIKWISFWLNSAKVSVLTNGEPRKEIICKKSLKLGDPLLPLLFVLVAKGLNLLFMHMKEAYKIEGLPAARSKSFTNL